MASMFYLFLILTCTSFLLYVPPFALFRDPGINRAVFLTIGVISQLICYKSGTKDH